jgi:effector-binding domain-containing protein
MQRYLKGDLDATVPGLAEAYKRVITFMLENIQDIQGSIRH